MQSTEETGTKAHPQLHQLRDQLQEIFDSISTYQPSISKPPILDSSLYLGPHTNEDSQWLQQDNVHGLKKLRDSVKIDLDVLEKFLKDANSINLPPLSTNAPYLIAVWNEVLCAPGRADAVFRSMPLDGPSVDARQRGNNNVRPAAAKVDVVADNGKRWVRVNTVKNSRMLAEFREIDSYLTDSDDSEWGDSDDPRPTLAQKEFDNSLLRMGRSLLSAAKANPVEGTGGVPSVTMRLTRLDPSPAPESEEQTDSRIAETIKLLEEMGIDVQLGERQPEELTAPTLRQEAAAAAAASPVSFKPTININLDLSVLIAIISDLTNAPLPKSVEEAKRRFIPPPEYQEWKKKKKALNGIKSIPDLGANEDESDEEGIPGDFVKHSRALTNQLLQEMNKGMIQEIHDQIAFISANGDSPVEVKFWATPEARDRCLRIISKIGGNSEKARAHALFWEESTILPQKLSITTAEQLYWQDSRYPQKFIHLFPINLYPPSAVPQASLHPDAKIERPIPSFFHFLAKTCKDILEQETMPHPRSLREKCQGQDTGELQRAVVTKANPRLTAHTVQSLLWGAELGWTTLTANKTSIRAILREVRLARITGRLDGVITEDVEGDCRAAIWVFDPRSLAEGVSSPT